MLIYNSLFSGTSISTSCHFLLLTTLAATVLQEEEYLSTESATFTKENEENLNVD